MIKFFENYERETLLLFATLLGITRWWVPGPSVLGNLYSVSHWTLSYDHGLVRRGLVGTIVKLWMPIISVEGVHLIALAAFCTFLVLLLIVFFSMWNGKANGRQLFRLFLLFTVTPVTLSFYAQDLGRFELFLAMIMLLSLVVLSVRRYIWLIPVLMVIAMFIHEAFMILYAPTIVAAIFFVYVREKRDKSLVAVLGISIIVVLVSFFLLYYYGRPSLPYNEFAHFMQSRANFIIPDLAIRECFFSGENHFDLTYPYWHDPGSIINFMMALFILSPVIIVLFQLWYYAVKNCEQYRWAGILFLLAPLSGLLLLAVATDYGRWISAVIFCNYFAIFFLINKNVIPVEQFDGFGKNNASWMFILLIITYMLFGPLHDWNPYPYQNNLIYSSLSIISVLLFDIGIIFRKYFQSKSVHPAI